ncbi:MAG: hypothetical protein FWC77_00850 [Defluviitaleaceae bacterium]|nr:hypothetical protein [Defluviitaleaceae bacterium]
MDSLQYANEFTAAYRAHSDTALREAACLRIQVPFILTPPKEGDLIVGSRRQPFLCINPHPEHGGNYIYCFNEERFRNEVGNIPEIINFWREERTEAKLDKAMEEKYGAPFPKSHAEPGAVNAFCRVGGTSMDFGKLIRLGLPGLSKEIQREGPFYEALSTALDMLDYALVYYRDRAQGEQSELLERIRHAAPQNFREGLQLFWIYATISDTIQYGRMDEYLGDLWAVDGDLELIMSLYENILRVGRVFDHRIIIGGRGRRNEKNANRLATALLEATLRHKEVIPQLTLRYYSGMDEALFDMGLRVNMAGTTFPIIYSDDVNIPAVAKLYNVPIQEAERYVPFGCGEYVLEGLSTGTPNVTGNCLKALELALFDGYDHHHHMQAGMKNIGPIQSFDDLWREYHHQLAENINRAVWHNKQNYTEAGKAAPLLFYCLLMDDCIEKGMGLLSGGVRYANASAEIFGIISAADSLTAIKKIVFEEKKFSLDDLRQMLLANFEGYETERKLLKSAPKYGNDIDDADQMAQRVFNHIAKLARDSGDEHGVNKYDIVSVNNMTSAQWGVYCIASADGRGAGAAINNGNSPAIGADKNGPTALLNSMAKFDAARHAGVINSLRITKELFQKNFTAIKALLETFFQNGGTQLNLTVIGKGDLENALREPEKYRDLIVRVGGFSARFVDLDPVTKQEIIQRTTYTAN